MNLHLDQRGEEDFAFYMDGDLQFDTRDEALYHESLVLPALSLAAQHAPNMPLRVLICGGGDGLALRECLRFPHVAHVDLVDYSADVVEWGQTHFANLNRQAFADPRAHVHIADAWEFLRAHANASSAISESNGGTERGQIPATPSAPELGYHAIVCDFTVPRRDEDTRVYSLEWYRLLRSALLPHGLLALNALSPEATPEAFWCLNQTVRAARLAPQPYRVCLPSFRAQGYGTWAFLLAGPRLHRRDLQQIVCPISTQQYDMAALWPSAQFSADERRRARQFAPHSLQSPSLMPLLLNPGMQFRSGMAFAPHSALAFTLPEARAELLPSVSPSAQEGNAPYDLNALLAAIPISHPYHTRVMIESLAEQVIGTIRKLDVQKLVDALLRRAQALPRSLQTELTRLRAYLQERMPRLELLGAWGRKLFVILVVLMTLANAIAPDNAFGKGTGSFGHASLSRGYGSSSSFGRGGGSFGKMAGQPSGSSFRGTPGFGSSFGSGGRATSGSFRAPAPIIRSSGFRRSYGSGQPTNIEGVVLPARSFRYVPYSHTHIYYGGSGYNGNVGSNSAAGQSEEHKAFFVADDDMLVLDNGDVVVTLSDTAYLLVSGSSVNLMSNKSPTPLLNLFPDGEFLRSILAQLQDQEAQVEAALAPRREWQEWVGWTSAFAGTIAEDKMEIRNLEDLQSRLQAALKQIQPGPEYTTAAPVPEPNAVELFVDGLLLQNGQATFRTADNKWVSTDGKMLFASGKSVGNCPPEMKDALKSVLIKLQKEFTGDVGSLSNDLGQLAQEKASLDKDLADYNQLYAANGNDPTYEVDYGTDEIAVSDAISKTQNDLTANESSTTETQTEKDKQTRDLERINQALQQLDL